MVIGTSKKKDRKKSSDLIEKKQQLKDMMSEKSPEVNVFVNAQIFHKPNMVWTAKERSLFLKLQYKSPSAFKMLKKMGFALPGLSTMRDWYNTIPFDTGLSDEMISIIKEKLEDGNPINRKCILLLDEMTIKNHLQYDEKTDKIYGYEDFQEFGRNATPARHALVFMLSGINKQWKQVIAHYYGTAKKDLLKDIILRLLEKLVAEGIEVVAVNCDQGSANRGAYDLMGVTVEDPWINVADGPIFCMHDVPHLFKSIRNNLLEHDIEIDGKLISWNILRKVFSEDSDTIRAMHKLTPAHINPDSFQKMKVKLATQVFSTHVATTIYASAQTDLFTDEERENVLATANFFSILNKGFDNLNSFKLIMSIRTKPPYHKRVKR